MNRAHDPSDIFTYKLRSTLRHWEFFNIIILCPFAHFSACILDLPDVFLAYFLLPPLPKIKLHEKSKKYVCFVVAFCFTPKTVLYT